MAAHASPPAKAAPAAAAPAAATPSRTISLVVIGGILFVVVGVECLLAYFFLPRSTAPAAPVAAEASHEAAAEEEHASHDEHAAEAPAHDAHGAHDAHAAAPAGGHGGGHAEPAAGHDAHASESSHGGHGGGGHGDMGTPGHAVVSPGAVHEVDLGTFRVSAYNPLSNMTLRIDFHLFGTITGRDLRDFDSLMSMHRNRIRDQVIVTVRSSEMADLADPGLGLIKRKILWTTNQTLGKPLLKSVIFGDFSCVEQ